VEVLRPHPPKPLSLTLQFMKRRDSVGRMRMSGSSVTHTRWQGGQLEEGSSVWVSISFEHRTKGEIRSGLVVSGSPHVRGDWRYVVQVPGVGYITGLQPAEISPVQFGKPRGSAVASEAGLFKASKAAVGVRHVRCFYVVVHTL
jgi:hypothetical protein